MCKSFFQLTSLICDPEGSQNTELIFLHLVFTFLIHTQVFEHEDFQSHSWANLQLSRVQNKKITKQNKKTSKHIHTHKKPTTQNTITKPQKNYHLQKNYQPNYSHK